MPDRVRHYSAQWDEDRDTIVGLEEFGQMVLEDLWRDLEAEIPPLEEQPDSTWRDEERAAVEEFVALAARDFVGREEITAELLALARSPVQDGAPWAACVTGEAGSGKSALLAHVYRQLAADIEPDAPRRRPGLVGRLLGRKGARESDLLILSHFAGVTPRSASVDSLLLRWCEELAEFLGEASPVEEGASAEDLEQAFASLLGQASLQTRVVVLLDALNQLEPTARGRYLTWLPALWPDNARLIVTAIPCTASGVLQERPGVADLPLGRLPEPEAGEIARRICARYHRTPHPEVLAALTGKRLPDGAAASGNPLWLTLAVEELNLLDEDDFERAEREFDGSGDERLHQLLLSVIAALPADVEGLYEWLLERTEEIWGDAWARGFANLLSLSRGGWRESDIEALLPTVSGEPWDPARFAGLRRSFRGQLVRRGAQGQWDFAHTQARLAIARRSLADAAAVRRLHALIADYLEELPSDDPLHESETMFHLIGADDRPRAARYFGGDLTEGELGGATARLAEPIIAGEGQEPNPGVQWTLSMVQSEDVDDAATGRGCDHVIFDLLDAIANGTRLNTHHALLEPTRDALQRLAAADPGNAAWQRDLAVSHNKVGDVLRAQGNLAGALEIGERLAAADPGNAGWQRDLAVSHNKVGDVLRAQGDLAGAVEAYEAALEIGERLAAADPGNAGWQRDLWVSHWRIADMMERTGHPDEARQWWQQAHDTLLDMKQSGVFVSAQDEQSLEQLRAKLGEA